MSDDVEDLGIDPTELEAAQPAAADDAPTEPDADSPVREEATADHFTDPGL